MPHKRQDGQVRNLLRREWAAPFSPVPGNRLFPIHDFARIGALLARVCGNARTESRQSTAERYHGPKKCVGRGKPRCLDRPAALVPYTARIKSTLTGPKSRLPLPYCSSIICFASNCDGAIT